MYWKIYQLWLQVKELLSAVSVLMIYHSNFTVPESYNSLNFLLVIINMLSDISSYASSSV